MEKTTISLAIDESKVDKDALYFIDWQKVKSVNDLMIIIASMGISFSPYHPAWDRIKAFVDYSNPMPLPNQPKAEPINLPKIKKPNGAE
jgi:hypothetical protein